MEGTETERRPTCASVLSFYSLWTEHFSFLCWIEHWKLNLIHSSASDYPGELCWTEGSAYAVTSSIKLTLPAVPAYKLWFIHILLSGNAMNAFLMDPVLDRMFNVYMMWRSPAYLFQSMKTCHWCVQVKWYILALRICDPFHKSDLLKFLAHRLQIESASRLTNDLLFAHCR